MVGLGGSVREGVGLGPGVEDAVRVGVLVGVRVAVPVTVREGVGVAVRVLVAVRLAVAVGVRVGVRVEVLDGPAVGLGVAVMAGGVTVKEPSISSRVTFVAEGSVAIPLSKCSATTPGSAVGRTLKEILAIVPSAVNSPLPPYTITRIVSADRCDHTRSFPTAEAASPLSTRLTANLALS